jgi:Zn-dependent peptidase ImmA (M78 family)
MPKVQLSISPKILSWAIGIAGKETLNPDAYNLLYQWQTGDKTPTFAKLEDVSNKTHIPLGYFFLTEPPKEDLPILEYRTMDSASVQNPSRELIDTVYHMENIQNWMHDYRVDNIGEPLPFVGSLKGEKNSDSFVAKLREDVKLDVQWYRDVNQKDVFKYIRTLFENIGVIITTNGVVGQNTHRHLNTDEFRAFTLIDNYAPLIFINSNDSDGAKLFSLLHEAAHIWAGISSFYNDRLGNHQSNRQTEALCNAVAAEILVPNTDFITQWQKIANDNRNVETMISGLAREFKCGESVIARRALDNHYITNSQYESMAKLAIQRYQEWCKRNKAKSSGGSYYNTEISRFGKPFILALDSSVHEGKALYSDAYSLTNTTRYTFDRLVNEAKGLI